MAKPGKMWQCDCPTIDHLIVLNESHLNRILAEYLEYYHQSRTHLSLDRNSPIPRGVEPPEHGPARAIPKVGGFPRRKSAVRLWCSRVTTSTLRSLSRQIMKYEQK